MTLPKSGFKILTDEEADEVKEELIFLLVISHNILQWTYTSGSGDTP